jgi:hypothetical protein
MPVTTIFLPSQHGFAYTNDWPAQSAVVLPTPFGDIGIGNAGGGLCGGMVFATLDYWHAGAVPPGERPRQGEPVFAYIVRRLIDSWHLPAGAAQYYQWMNLPDGDRGFTAFGRHVVIERGLAWRTIRVQWPQIATDLDKAIPVALGVVTTASIDPRDLGLNHQVLAYDYEKVDGRVTIRVYDPNSGQRDDVFIAFDTTSPTRPTNFAHNLDLDHPVRGFFRTAYAPTVPPPA